jgi:hypothetical protein
MLAAFGDTSFCCDYFTPITCNTSPDDWHKRSANCDKNGAASRLRSVCHQSTYACTNVTQMDLLTTTIIVALQEAITNLQKHGSIMRVAPAPPCGGMRQGKTALKQQHVEHQVVVCLLAAL